MYLNRCKILLQHPEYHKPQHQHPLIAQDWVFFVNRITKLQQPQLQDRAHLQRWYWHRPYPETRAQDQNFNNINLSL